MKSKHEPHALQRFFWPFFGVMTLTPMSLDHTHAGPISRSTASAASAAVDVQHFCTGLSEAMEDVFQSCGKVVPPKRDVNDG